MPYKLISTKEDNYQIINGDAYTDFNPTDEVIPIIDKLFQENCKIERLSIRKGKGNRKEELLKVTLNNNTSFYVYCFQTESGGRCYSIKNGENEARIQWRSNNNWNPKLETLKPALEFSDKMLKGHDLKNSRCFVIGVYKRNTFDNDIVLSAVYPTQAQEVEIASKTNKSIQFKYSDIQEAFKSSLSYTLKKNDHLVVHFKPSFFGWYLVRQDEIHSKSKFAIDGYLEEQKKRQYTNKEVKSFFQNSYYVNSDTSIIESPSESYGDTAKFQSDLRNLIKENLLLKALEFVMNKRPHLEISTAKSLVQHEYLKLKHATE
jgi:hypothetical protein